MSWAMRWAMWRGIGLQGVTVVAVALLVLGLGTAAAPAAGAPARQGAPAAGAVVGLAGTPHLWIADDQGVLHWGGDTRGVQGRFIDWGRRTDVSLAALKAMRRGDPWLSAGVLKDGDPIYFVKWETEWAQPQLLHIQSIADVELFGINATNYGSLVLDRAQWEQRFGLTAAGLQRGQLAPAEPPAEPPTAANANVVAINQPLLIERGGETSGLQSYWAGVEFKLVSVERTDAGRQVWRFALWNRNATGHVAIQGCRSSCRSQFLVSSAGTRHDAFPWDGADAAAGERKEITLVFNASAVPATYRLSLIGAQVSFHATDPIAPGSQDLLTWVPLSVTLP